MNAEKRTLFVIIGCSRSGTTLLSEVLNRNDDVFVSPETKYFLRVYGHRQFLRFVPRKLRAERSVRALLHAEYPRVAPIFPEHEEAFRSILETEPDHLKQFVAILRELSDRPVVGEKTPWHVVFGDVIVRGIPDIHLVAICRDAPAVVASHLGRKGFRRVASVTQCAARWALMNGHVLRARRLVDESRFHLLTFEELIRSPQQTVERLCARLGIEYQEAMLRPEYRDSSFSERQPVGAGFDEGALHEWRKRLTDDQVRFIRGCTADIAAELGYPDDGVRPTVPERVAFRAELAYQSFLVRVMRAGLHPVGPVTARW